MSVQTMSLLNPVLCHIKNLAKSIQYWTCHVPFHEHIRMRTLLQRHDASGPRYTHSKNGKFQKCDLPGIVPLLRVSCSFHQAHAYEIGGRCVRHLDEKLCSDLWQEFTEHGTAATLKHSQCNYLNTLCFLKLEKICKTRRMTSTLECDQNRSCRTHSKGEK